MATAAGGSRPDVFCALVQDPKMIMELRTRASTALRAKFSFPEFHAVVLCDGTVPLHVLEAKVMRWIEQRIDSP